ncbi:Uncharacterised protein [Streptococcus pneumoniae]|nr:Uncharacterised protein [Streptococcus pneumoniae]
MITSSEIVPGFEKLMPSKCARTRFVTSRMSAARSFIYSLSMFSNIEINIDATSSIANSAFTFSLFTLSFTGFTSSGSFNTNKCASKIAALSAPSSAKAWSLIASNSVFAFSSAASKRAISAASFVIDFFSMLNSGFSSLKAFAIAIPLDAAIP